MRSAVFFLRTIKEADLFSLLWLFESDILSMLPAIGSSSDDEWNDIYLFE